MNYSSFNSFKRSNFFPKFAKSFFKNSNQFKMFSHVNPQKKVISMKNLLFNQNLLQLVKFNFINYKIQAAQLMLIGDSEVINDTEEDDTGLNGLIKCDSTSLSLHNLLCEGNIFN